jgi:hypothetical protein
MAELLEALNTVHRCGFVHRDVKPDNVVLTTQGHLKLLDFGLCRQEPPVSMLDASNQSGTETSKRKQLRSMVGTPQYMAPEVFEADYGAEADIWSLGIITYECLVGIVPFHGAQYKGREAVQLIRAKVADHASVLEKQMAKAKVRGFIEQPAEDFLQRVICVRERRLTAMQCRDHPFFLGLDFQCLHRLRPPIVPSVSSRNDTKHFDNFKFRPLPDPQVQAKDMSMEWVHYDFDRDRKNLLLAAAGHDATDQEDWSTQPCERQEQRFVVQLQREVSLQAIRLCPAGHTLEAVGTTLDDGWCCSDMTELGGCRSNITSFFQTRGMNRFRCFVCDYDLCEKCFRTMPERAEAGQNLPWMQQEHQYTDHQALWVEHEDQRHCPWEGQDDWWVQQQSYWQQPHQNSPWGQQQQWGQQGQW